MTPTFGNKHDGSDACLSRYFTGGIVAFGSVLQPGCTKTDSKANLEQGAYLASGGVTEAEPQQPAPPDTSAQPPPSMIAPLQALQDAPQDPPDQEARVDPAAETDHPSGDAAKLFSIADDDATPAPQTPLPQLPDDLPPAKLIQVLDDTDKDMQLIVTGRSGITDPREAQNADPFHEVEVRGVANAFEAP